MPIMVLADDIHFPKKSYKCIMGVAALGVIY